MMILSLSVVYIFSKHPMPLRWQAAGKRFKLFSRETKTFEGEKICHRSCLFGLHLFNQRVQFVDRQSIHFLPDLSDEILRDKGRHQ
jgi:hypothetical protein